MRCVNPAAQQSVLSPAGTTIVVSPMYSAMFVVLQKQQSAISRPCQNVLEVSGRSCIIYVCSSELNTRCVVVTCSQAAFMRSHVRRRTETAERGST